MTTLYAERRDAMISHALRDFTAADFKALETLKGTKKSIMMLHTRGMIEFAYTDDIKIVLQRTELGDKTLEARERNAGTDTQGRGNDTNHARRCGDQNNCRENRGKSRENRD